MKNYKEGVRERRPEVNDGWQRLSKVLTGIGKVKVRKGKSRNVKLATGTLWIIT